MLPGRFALVALVGVGACFNPRYQDPMCGPNGECPAGLSCVAGVCRTQVPDDAADDEADAADAGPDDAGVDSPVDGLVTLVFQQGLNGYTGTHDTYLDGGTPTATRGGDSAARWRYEPDDKDRSALIRFAGIFDPGAIPTTATIVSATLTFVMEQSNATGGIAEVAIPWDASTITFATFGADPGVDPTDIGTVLGLAPTTNGTHDLDVKDTVERWRTNQIGNHGWVFAPTDTGSGDSSFRTSESLDKPKLTVTYY